MLFNSLVVALASGLVLQTVATPISNNGLKTKREVPHTHSLHERHLSHWSNVWTKKSKVPDTQLLPMRIGLKQSNLEAGHDLLMDM